MIESGSRVFVNYHAKILMVLDKCLEQTFKIYYYYHYFLLKCS